VAYSADGKTILSGSDDGKLRTWNPRTGQPARTWPGHGKSVRQVVAVPHTAEFLTAGDDDVVVMWDAETAKGQRRLTPAAESEKCTTPGA